MLSVFARTRLMLLGLSLGLSLSAAACKEPAKKKADDDAGGKAGAGAGGDSTLSGAGGKGAGASTTKSSTPPDLNTGPSGMHEGDETEGVTNKKAKTPLDGGAGALGDTLDGAALFGEHCGGCHGDFESLATPAGQRFGNMLGQSAAAIQTAIKVVPPMKTLATTTSAEEIDAIALALAVGSGVEGSTAPAVVPAQPTRGGLDINNLISTFGSVVGSIFGGGSSQPGAPSAPTAPVQVCRGNNGRGYGCLYRCGQAVCAKDDAAMAVPCVSTARDYFCQP